MSTRIYVDIIYGVDLVQVFIKCRVDIITHFREIVYMRFYVSISEKEFLHMIQLSTIFFIKCFSSPQLKAEVSFSDQLAAFTVCTSVCLYVCKPFTLSTCSPESSARFEHLYKASLDNYQSNYIHDF